MSDAIKAAQAWLQNAKSRGLTVTYFDGQILVFGEGKQKKYRDLLDSVEQHRPALVTILERDDPDTRFAMARGAYADPGDLEGHG
jgi:hypothetical protein